MNTIGGPLIEGIGGLIGGIFWNLISTGGGTFTTQILEFIKNIIKPIIGEPIRVISGV